VSLWLDLGYAKNPYDVNPLPASEEGAELLVGREVEVRTLLSKLGNSTLHPTLEGDNGVGKTSIVLVAAYRAMRDHREGRKRQLFLPINSIFQLGSSADDFERRVYFEVAQAFIQYADPLRDAGYDVPNLDEIRRWLTDPIISGGGGGLQILGSGFNGERSNEANTSAGFTDSGFAQAIRAALQAAFPTPEHGGFVAVIDNIELLQLSNEAKRALERLRDTSLSLPGIRWVLCGAKGIVRAAVSSPRLTGRIAAPLEVKPIPDHVVEELIEARLSHFANSADAKAPVGPDGFRHLYEISNKNLRDALKYAQDFSIWLDVQGETHKPAEEFADLLEVWLAEEAIAIESSITLQPRMWKLFTDLCEAGGTCAPGDYEAFGFSSLQRMRSNFAELERAGLVSAEVDEDDHRRRTVTITSKGWLVHYARSGFTGRAAGPT
jgi:hypothetical protein